MHLLPLQYDILRVKECYISNAPEVGFQLESLVYKICLIVSRLSVLSSVLLKR